MSSLTPLKSRGAAPDHRGVGSGEGVVLSNGFFASSNGIELPLLNGAAAAALALTGPGAYSIDAALGLASAWTPALSTLVLFIGIVAGFANLILRQLRQPLAQAVRG